MAIIAVILKIIRSLYTSPDPGTPGCFPGWWVHTGDVITERVAGWDVEKGAQLRSRIA